VLCGVLKMIVGTQKSKRFFLKLEYIYLRLPKNKKDVLSLASAINRAQFKVTTDSLNIHY